MIAELIVEFTIILLAPIVYPLYLWKVKGAPTAQAFQHWKIFAGLYLLFFSLLVSHFASANVTNCYSIKDSDKKNYCLALNHRQASYCYSIKNRDDKNLCLAQTHQQRSYCYSIQESDLKNQCLGMLK